ncbi:MAG: hypothetical protein GY758_22605 [Fuerstiella sp.]|nr:hypothetical protein [Fuerstiella sp.]MCP4786960.1 hypothetical protein [Fuerstiella sp.]MCP4859335.1 hypothetical protein [Fuerstiella sp.]
MQIRRQHFFSVLSVCAVSVNAAFAQSAVWGLQREDRFSVETTIDRETIVQLADSAPVTSTSREQLELEYLVWRVTPLETVMQVRVVLFVRIGNSGNAFTDSLFDQRLKLLERIPIMIAVDPNGVVTNMSGYMESLKQFAGPDQNMLQLLQEACPQQSFQSWIGRPFWMTQPDNGDEDGKTWERVDQLSLGLMGGLRTVATCRIESQEDNSANVVVAGATRHIAPPPDRNASPRSVSFTGVKVKAESFSGEGRMLLPEKATDDDPTSVKLRPWFASLTLNWSIKGEANVKSGGRSQKVTFEHRQKQASELQPNYQMGRRLSGARPPSFRTPLKPAP